MGSKFSGKTEKFVLIELYNVLYEKFENNFSRVAFKIFNKSNYFKGFIT